MHLQVFLCFVLLYLYKNWKCSMCLYRPSCLFFLHSDCVSPPITATRVIARRKPHVHAFEYSRMLSFIPARLHAWREQRGTLQNLCEHQRLRWNVQWRTYTKSLRISPADDISMTHSCARSYRCTVRVPFPLTLTSTRYLTLLLMKTQKPIYQCERDYV